MRRRSLAQQRGLHIFINGLLFVLCYPLTNYLAHQANVQTNVLMSFEPLAPFIPWMIVPYASSPLLLAASFFMVNRPTELQTLNHRMIFCTLLACLIFAAIPLHFPLVRPEPSQPALAISYRLLDMLDQPYNQLPSLHVAYCVMLWRTLPRSFWLTLWLSMITVSTILTWQHLLADVAGGVVLGLLACAMVPHVQNTRQIVACYYLTAAILVLLLSCAINYIWLGSYFALSLALVARAYILNDTGFLTKQAGCHPAWIWGCYWPYLIGYRFCWQVVHHYRPQAWEKKLPRLLVGRRLCASEAKELHSGCSVIDLSPELSEPCELWKAYWHFPLLDMCAPTPAQLRPLLERLHIELQTGHTVYLHCAMGMSRSQFVAHLYLKKTST